MKANPAISLFVSILFILFSTIHAFAFRCGSDLVTTGDSRTKVKVTCGNPTSKENKCKNVLTTTTKSGKTKTKCDEKVEVWYYNCGEGDFIYALTFENNTLTNEDTEGRGNGKSDCRGK